MCRSGLPPPLAGEGWGGGTYKRGGDIFDNIARARHHVMIVETENPKAFGCKECVAASVALQLLFFKMLTAVELHNQIGCMTDKIYNVRPNRSLPPKARAVQSMSAQRSPNKLLNNS